jgi:hypothetical protein
MPASIYDRASRESLVLRLDGLPHDRRPLWGRMTAPQMITHLLEAYRMPGGELSIPRRPVPLRPLVKWLMLYVLPFPKGAPTAKQLLARKPSSWDADVAALRAVILSTEQPPAGAPVGDHPIFGTMTVKEWGVLVYKHTDHHLRQFGV